MLCLIRCNICSTSEQIHDKGEVFKKHTGMHENENMPSVFDFIDPAEWLREIFQYLKVRDSKYSIRKWSTELGISNSGTLSSMLSGKRRIPLSTVTALTKQLELSSLDKSYLIFIALAQEGVSPATKRQVQALLRHQSYIEKHSSPLFQIVEETASTWLAPAIFNSPSLNNGEWSEESLLGLLPEHERPRAKKIIEMFLANGVFEQKGNKITAMRESLDYVPKETQSIRHFHRESILKSLETLDSEPVDRRYFHSTSVVLDSGILPVFFETLKKFHLDFLKSNSKNSGDRVYQLNSQMVPLTRFIDKGN